MPAYIYKLHFRSTVHFGDADADLESVQERVSSDTLFSALINTANMYLGKTAADEIVDRFLTDKPPFIISSLFVFCKDTYYLPKPLDDSFLCPEIKRVFGKSLKKLQWLDLNDFSKWVKKSLKHEELEHTINKTEKYNDSFYKFTRPRVSLDRTTQASSIYHCSYIKFKEKSGLYGFVVFYEKSISKLFFELLTLLGNTGIGGEKTYGCGTFSVEFEEVSDKFKEILTMKTDTYTLLSLYHPTEQESLNLSDKLIAYDFIRRKGWITSGRNSLPFKRKSIGFLKEGSVFNQYVRGGVFEVTPEGISAKDLNHRVYRYSHAFLCPIEG